jgi:hypothetical protein
MKVEEMAMRERRWRSELDAATTEKEVLNTAKDYVAFLAKSERDSLPPDFELGPLESCTDVGDLALRLVQASMHFESESEGLRLLRRMSVFFAAASERFTELGIPPSEDDDYDK